MSAIQRAFELARTGKYENFTGVKKALRHEFHVESQLVGKQLSTDITRVCKEAHLRVSAGGRSEGATGGNAR